MKQAHLYVFLFLFGLLLPRMGMATHNRAGEITYEHIGGNNYRITITTCTKTSAPADRPNLEVRWGDDSGVDSVERDDITTITGYDAQINTYVTTHSFPGPGTYEVRVEDPNRNSGVVNIPNSVSRSFCIRTELVIAPFSNLHNNSVQFTRRACNERACVGKPYKHNVGAVDPDGDSLVYELVEPRGNNCQIIGDYGFPDECASCQPGPNNDISIDQETGDLIWDAPQVQGEFNVAIKVSEYREGQFVGSVVRDMQIRVTSCDDEPPELNELKDTCVVAGTDLEFEVSATDPDDGEDINLQATGEPLFLDESPAVFPQGVVSSDSVTGTFEWETSCAHVRPGEYRVLFEARDEANPVALVDFKTIFIEVVAPAPKNPTATPSGNDIEVEWDESVCQNADGYDIYRRLGTYGYNPDHCQTGVPGYTGYQKIGETDDVSGNIFVDDGELVHGQEYCYMVVATFENGAESIASKEVCAELIKDVPIITHSSVGSTDVNTGIDTVQWAKPTEADTVNQYPGPYHYEVYRDEGYESATNYVGSTDTTALLADADTTFIDSNVNTVDGPHSYRVELYSGGDEFVGETNVASTIFLEFSPNDQRLLIEWDEQVPWTNHEYEVYRSDDGGSSYVHIGTTPEQEFLDTALVNGKEYCYYVKSIGEYSADGLVDPIINFSQEGCAMPEDRNPPCPPTVRADPECEDFAGQILWTPASPNCGCPEPFWPEDDPQCGGDEAEYRLFRKTTPDGEYELIADGIGAQEADYRFRDERSIAGCYAMTAIDSAGNESEMSDSVCVDNCPVYELPNVFTPNGDGVNDLMTPVRKRYVEKVEISIRNRWGQTVYETEDPNIEWDGTNQNTGEPASEGVYFYVCKVHTIRLSGIKVVDLTGKVQILRGDPQRRP